MANFNIALPSIVGKLSDPSVPYPSLLIGYFEQFSISIASVVAMYRLFPVHGGPGGDLTFELIVLFVSTVVAVGVINAVV